MTTYRHNTVERCVKCQQPWAGWGLVCNDCRQIEAIEKVQKSQNHSNYSVLSIPTPDAGLIFPLVVIFLFFYVNYLLNWLPLKIMWWILVMIVTIVSSFF